MMVTLRFSGRLIVHLASCKSFVFLFLYEDNYTMAAKLMTRGDYMISECIHMHGLP